MMIRVIYLSLCITILCAKAMEYDQLDKELLQNSVPPDQHQPCTSDFSSILNKIIPQSSGKPVVPTLPLQHLSNPGARKKKKEIYRHSCTIRLTINNTTKTATLLHISGNKNQPCSSFIYICDLCSRDLSFILFTELKRNNKELQQTIINNINNHYESFHYNMMPLVITFPDGT